MIFFLALNLHLEFWLTPLCHHQQRSERHWRWLFSWERILPDSNWGFGGELSVCAKSFDSFFLLVVHLSYRISVRDHFLEYHQLQCLQLACHDSAVLVEIEGLFDTLIPQSLCAVYGKFRQKLAAEVHRYLMARWAVVLRLMEARKHQRGPRGLKLNP